ncbi:unnamed protein product [Peniophora sp. CBMAI 1063]|nr:unnamed protein product [Peniophora sp. CBMAI 1063]
MLQAMDVAPQTTQPSASSQPSTSRLAPAVQRTSTRRPIPVKRLRLEEQDDIKPASQSAPMPTPPTSPSDSLAAKRRRIQAEIAVEEAEAAARQARATLLRTQLEEAEAAESQVAPRGTVSPVKSERRPSPISVPRRGEVIDLTGEL